MRKLSILLVLVAACGDDGVRHTPDATLHDAPAVTDGAPDAPLLPVSIAVVNGDAAVSGVHVYFLNADSTVVLATTTDATGTASAVMVAGGSVTAVDPFATGQVSNHTIETFMAVTPGDHLLLTQPDQAMATTITVIAPIDSAASVASYEVQTPCGTSNLVDPGSGASPSAQFDLNDCGSSTDFYIITRDQNAQIIDYIFKSGVAVSAGATIDLTAETYAAGATRTVTITGIPAQQEIGFSDSLVGPHGLFLTQSGSTTDGSPQPVSTVGIGRHVVSSQLYASPATHVFADWGPYSTTYSLDIPARELPQLTAFPAIDNASQSVALAEDAGGVTPDVLLTSVGAFRSLDETSWLWRVAAPHATTVVLPHLPTDVYDFNFKANDETFSNGAIIGKVPGGYDAIRPYLLSANLQGISDLTTGAAGSVTLEVLQGKGPI